MDKDSHIKNWPSIGVHSEKIRYVCSNYTFIRSPGRFTTVCKNYTKFPSGVKCDKKNQLKVTFLSSWRLLCVPWNVNQIFLFLHDLDDQIITHIGSHTWLTHDHHHKWAKNFDWTDIKFYCSACLLAIHFDLCYFLFLYLLEVRRFLNDIGYALLYHLLQELEAAKSDYRAMLLSSGKKHIHILPRHTFE